MDILTAKEIFNYLYQDVNGHAIAAEGKELNEHRGKGFVYGEIEPDSFYNFMRTTHPKEGEIFYDLGSGTGKAVLLAHMLFNFSQSKGIELIETLFNQSTRIKTFYQAYMKLQHFKEKKQGILIPSEQNKTLDFIHGSFIDIDFSDADIVYMHSTCWPRGLMQRLRGKLALLKAGTRLLSVSTPLFPSKNYEIINEEEFTFGWGEATVYTSLKLSEAEPYVPNVYTYLGNYKE